MLVRACFVVMSEFVNTDCSHSCTLSIPILLPLVSCHVCIMMYISGLVIKHNSTQLIGNYSVLCWTQSFLCLEQSSTRGPTSVRDPSEYLHSWVEILPNFDQVDRFVQVIVIVKSNIFTLLSSHFTCVYTAMYFARPNPCLGQGNSQHMYQAHIFPSTANHVTSHSEFAIRPTLDRYCADAGWHQVTSTPLWSAAPGLQLCTIICL